LAITFGGKESTICKNSHDLRKCEKNTNEYFVQEFIMELKERSTHLFILNGIIKWGICYEIKHHARYHIQKGRMEKYKKITDFNFNVFQDIFIKLNYTGFACIDFKIINGKIKIFEINPRLGGTLVHGNNFEELITYISKNI
jgi:glutathione synthase/RimK-type ligase-like ATP-grasp enzyme